jgi:putative tryptophan/tyrosine transport system substrate-binding protein
MTHFGSRRPKCCEALPESCFEPIRMSCLSAGLGMKRRQFIGMCVSATATWPSFVFAQDHYRQRKLCVLVSTAENDPDTQPRIEALRQALRDLGWIEGENIHVEYRWGSGSAALIGRYAQEIVALAPDIILASGTPVVGALKPLTQTIPIVFALAIDPVGVGFVDSLSRPRGNITGFTFINAELIGKWTVMLRDAAPYLRRAALLYNPKINPWYANFLREIAAAPQSVALELVPTPFNTPDDLMARIPTLASSPGTGLIIGPEASLTGHLNVIAALAAAMRMPSISVYRQFCIDGGLMSYGPDTVAIFRASAGYIDRILKGTDLAALPVQQPTKYLFSVNLKAAAALGATVPPTLVATADEVIE